MNTPRYLCAPAFCCYAPGRTFANEQAALQYAREAADRFQVPFVVWERHRATYRILSRVEPAPVRA
jgi:hypothetical protein